MLNLLGEGVNCYSGTRCSLYFCFQNREEMVGLRRAYIYEFLSSHTVGGLAMRRILTILIVLALGMVPSTALAGEGPLALPEGANSEANMHNEEGIKHWNQGHYDVALKHFKEASAIDSSLGEVHFNEAISLDKVGKHGMATMHFKAALKRAGGNAKILDSDILHGHIGH